MLTTRVASATLPGFATADRSFDGTGKQISDQPCQSGIQEPMAVAKRTGVQNDNHKDVTEMMLKITVIIFVLIAISSPLRANLIQNGNFATGDFTDWVFFATANGISGVAPLPEITLFDISGTGLTTTAEFQAGQVTYQGWGHPAGGGIAQTVSIIAGVFSFKADIAVQAIYPNLDSGTFSVLVDGLSKDSVNFGPIDYSPPFDGPLLRGTLAFTSALSAGSHEIEILITRNFIESDFTPEQFITDISLVPQATDPQPPDPQATMTPEPATWTILGAALAALSVSCRRLVRRHRGRPGRWLSARFGLTLGLLGEELNGLPPRLRRAGSPGCGRASR
jgi:hypothetical protein